MPRIPDDRPIQEIVDRFSPATKKRKIKYALEMLDNCIPEFRKINDTTPVEIKIEAKIDHKDCWIELLILSPSDFQKELNNWLQEELYVGRPEMLDLSRLSPVNIRGIHLEGLDLRHVNFGKSYDFRGATWDEHTQFNETFGNPADRGMIKIEKPGPIIADAPKTQRSSYNN